MPHLHDANRSTSDHTNPTPRPDRRGVLVSVTLCDNDEVTEPVDRWCPTPWKKLRTDDPVFAARMANAHSILFSENIKPYPCPCGLWHLRDARKHNRNHKQRKKANKRLREAQEGA